MTHRTMSEHSYHGATSRYYTVVINCVCVHSDGTLSVKGENY